MNNFDTWACTKQPFFNLETFYFWNQLKINKFATKIILVLKKNYLVE